MEIIENSNCIDNSYLPLSIQFGLIEDTLKAMGTLNVLDNRAIPLSKLNHSIEIEIKCGATVKVGAYFARLLKQYNHNERALKFIIQVLYRVLKSFTENESSAASKFALTADWAKLMVDLLFSSTWNNTMISDVLLCLKLYVKAANDNDIVQRIWIALLASDAFNGCLTPTSVYVLLQFFDEFSVIVDNFENGPEIERFLLKLLMSDVREDRKAALHLMRRFTKGPILSANNSWLLYITILENMEENQSHLILPSLDYLKCDSFKKFNLPVWLDILYIKILSHQNILVKRWAVEHILETQTCVDLAPDVLLHFIQASNHTNLYNYEGYFLPSEHMQTFLKGGCRLFLEAMARVNLKCVPMHFWLKQIWSYEPMSTEYSRGLILTIASKIRSLQNLCIREKSIELHQHIFCESIHGMRLSEYVGLVEALYNVTDPYNQFKTFADKLIQSLEAGVEISLTQRFYEIVTNNLCNELTIDHPHLKYIHAPDTEIGVTNVTHSNAFTKEILNIIKNIKLGEKEDMIWIRLMAAFELEDSAAVHKLFQEYWDLNLKKLIDLPFEVIRSQIVLKLANNENTATFVHEKCTDFFAQEFLSKFSDISNYLVTVEDILTMGSHKSLLKLSTLLADHTKEVNILVIGTFLKTLKRFSRMSSLCFTVTTNLLKYLKNVYSSLQLEEYATQILFTDVENVGICAAVLNSGIKFKIETYVNGIMIGVSKSGDVRVEEIYILKNIRMQCPRLHQIRLMYIKSVPVDFAGQLLDELFKKHNVLSRKKQRYFENSMDHRLKMRILHAIVFRVQSNTGFLHEDLFNSLLNQNNQLNINYMYELLAAKSIPNVGFILDKLQKVANCAPSYQVSLVSVAYCYSILNWPTISRESLELIINKLLPLTMGSHFQTRLYSQLVIYNLLEKSMHKFSGEYLLSNGTCLHNAISSAIGPQIKELSDDVRLLLPHIYLKAPTEFYDILMYVTMAPADEYLWYLDYSKYEASRNIFSNKITTFLKQNQNSKESYVRSGDLINIQRKVNPKSYFCSMNSLIPPKAANDCEMFIVTSLIDKVPNLGGIARTCEVLGIQNLILNSKLVVEKEDFKSLSMTAEKSLRIIEVRSTGLLEFFKEKQGDGFKIVGAEQTVGSANIIDFKFPRKCVLVLGHEKEGIPSDILGFLDFTVEVPQFGILRSLNVHVTAALFMWEYCKQHIVGNIASNSQ